MTSVRYEQSMKVNSKTIAGTPADIARVSWQWQKNDVPSQLVHDLYSAYLKGRREPNDTAIHEGLKSFLQSVEAYVRSRVSERDRAVCVLCKHACEQARSAVDQNAIDHACRHLGKALSVTAIPDVSAEARHRCRAEILPVEAYVDLRCGDAKAARRRYIESLKADQKLEDDFGPKSIHAHRIHVAIRLAGVEGVASRWKEATELTVALFMYLAGKTQALPLPGDWGPKYIGTLSPEMVQFLALQLTYELAGWLAESSSATVHEVMGRILASAAFRDEEARNFWNSSTRNWLELKMLSTGATMPFLWNCLFFLEGGPRQSISIWLAGALDAVAICDVLAPDAAAPFKSDVVNSVKALKYVPIRLQRAAWHMGAGMVSSQSQASKFSGDVKSLLYPTNNPQPQN
ncbi:MAG TPA: hypothetical protein VJA94_07880 [Candidatus Angelobacter sp.]